MSHGDYEITFEPRHKALNRPFIESSFDLFVDQLELNFYITDRYMPDRELSWRFLNFSNLWQKCLNHLKFH